MSTSRSAGVAIATLFLCTAVYSQTLIALGLVV